MQNIMKFENHPVRMWQNDKGELVIVAKDVAEALGYADSSLETIGRLFQNVPAEWKGRKRIPVPEEWKMVRSVLTTFGTKDTICLTEQGLYFFLGRSDKPAALPFQKWLAGEVLPSIRKHGAYMTQQTLDKALTSPDFLIQLATKLKEEQEKVKELEPKAKALDDFTNVPDALLVRDAAKLLSNDSNIQIGEHELRQWLVDNGWIYRQPNQSWCAASSRVRQGHMVMVSSRSHGIHKDGTPFAYPPTPKLTRKGLALIHQRLSEQSFERVLDAEVAA